MKFNPAKNVSNPIKEGTVNFVVEEWQETTSKSGDDLLVVKLKVTDKDGTSKTLFDRFSPSNEKSIWALGLLAKAADVYEQYSAGEISEQDIVGKKGRCDVAYDEYESSDGENRKSLKVKKYHFK